VHSSAQSVAQRLAVAAGSGRWQNWSVAAREFESAPVAGTGAGDYRFWWALDRPIDLTVENAHSLYLEVLAESGLVGLMLLLLPAAAIAVAVGRMFARGAPPALQRDLSVAVAACSVVVLHLAGDWDWQLPAVTLPAVVLGGGALKAASIVARPAGRAVTSRRPARWPLAFGCLAAIWLVAGPVASADRLGEARAAARQGRLAQALVLARRAERLDPQSPDGYVLEGDVLTDLGRPGRSNGAFAAALARSPRDWSILADWASALLRQGDRPAARVVVARALVLNSREPALRYLAGAARLLPGQPKANH
jgi:tetratricopeptide (TPR) repeat protein